MINVDNLPVGKKVLLQLSGGKDSIACLLSLLENNVVVEAIHFTHIYGYEIPTEQTKMICDKTGTNLTIIDITTDINRLFLPSFNQRPCRYCKSIMDRMTVAYAIANNFDVICVGDTADDKMLINRVLKGNGCLSEYSRYFNKEVDLPKNISIYRPLIHASGEKTLAYVHSKVPNFHRVNDTGDKYFEYSREGCPLQFKDYGAAYSEDLMKNLKKYNTLCSEFASNKGIKASIHLPSEFIVTIPKGYEDECREYLKKRGVVFLQNQRHQIKTYTSIIQIYSTIGCSDDTVKESIVKRFLERIELSVSEIVTNENCIFVVNDDYSLSVTMNSSLSIITITLVTIGSVAKSLLENVSVEIFHTYNFQISQIEATL